MVIKTRWNVASILLLLLTLTSAPAQEGRPELHLEGTGRACAGHFLVNAKQVAWTSPYAACTASYQVIGHEGLDWTLKLHAATTCKPFSVITIRKTDANDPDSFWNIAGYKQAFDASKKPDAARLSCLMY
jgi:hypothetical protein